MDKEMTQLLEESLDRVRNDKDHYDIEAVISVLHFEHTIALRHIAELEAELKEANSALLDYHDCYGWYKETKNKPAIDRALKES